MAAPVHKISSGKVILAVWENTSRKDGSTYYSFQPQRNNYNPETKEANYGNSFYESDLGNLLAAVIQAINWDGQRSTINPTSNPTTGGLTEEDGEELQEWARHTFPGGLNNLQVLGALNVTKMGEYSGTLEQAKQQLSGRFGD